MKFSILSADHTVSKICFGCEALGGQDWGKVNLKEIEFALERALDLGVNFLDTADVYGLGLSEKRIAKILGPRRFDVIIATKGGVEWHKRTKGRARTSFNSSVSHIRKSVENSLDRLKLETIPIYYIHWPDPNTEIKATFELLSRLQLEGKIGKIGCSNFSIDQIREASEVSDLSIIQMPINLLIGELSESYKTLCKDNKLSIVAYNSLASGMLTGKFSKDSTFFNNDRRSRLPLFQGKKFKSSLESVAKLESKAKKEGITLSQYAIKWTLNNDFVKSVIVGIKNSDQAEENISAVTQ